ncbi:MAG: nickel transporter [Candidatus Thiodiazotropha sp. (ex. Lucinisca nassula)]|nr:nickel transporter [Candidatus Thiodiazotropha sp. (ex. Lucinisca nassula)]
MKLIPVIDMMHNRVVVANSGKRHAYAAADTPLCRSSRPQEVLSALLDLYPFDTLYIADLDAICGSGSNLELIYALHLKYPEINLWVDNGLTDLGRLCGFARPVIGTESIVSCEQLAHLVASLPSPVLSLDYHGDHFKGPAGLDRHVDYWPEDVIVMSLTRVGTSTGPDTTRLQQFLNLQPRLRLYAAGGIRDQQDLQQLRSIGAAGVLLSTALHQGAIDHGVIDRFINA